VPNEVLITFPGQQFVVAGVLAGAYLTRGIVYHKAVSHKCQAASNSTDGMPQLAYLNQRATEKVCQSCHLALGEGE
jgi:hypothetical protein